MSTRDTLRWRKQSKQFRPTPFASWECGARAETRRKPNSERKGEMSYRIAVWNCRKKQETSENNAGLNMALCAFWFTLWGFLLSFHVCIINLNIVWRQKNWLNCSSWQEVQPLNRLFSYFYPPSIIIWAAREACYLRWSIEKLFFI